MGVGSVSMPSPTVRGGGLRDLLVILAPLLIGPTPLDIVDGFDPTPRLAPFEAYLVGLACVVCGAEW